MPVPTLPMDMPMPATGQAPAAFPTDLMREEIAMIIFTDTYRELRNLGISAVDSARVGPTSPADEVVDRVLAALGIGAPGAHVVVDNDRLSAAMRAVHTDTPRALIALGRDPVAFSESAIFCHEGQMYDTVRAIAHAAGATVAHTWSYRVPLAGRPR